jgi:hypothetical protein
MESQAVSSQGAHIEVESGEGTALTATAVTAAAPPVVTVAAHTLVAGDVVAADGVGTTPLWDIVDEKDHVVSPLTATTFELVGVDATDEAAATAGSFTPKTWLALCEAKTFQGFDGQASEIDVTTLCSTAKEFRPGLQDFGSFSFEMNLVPTDPSQMVLDAAKASGAALWFRVYVPDGEGGYQGAYVFKAFVRQKSIAGGVDQAMTSSVTLRVTGEPVFVAWVSP